MIKNNLSTYGHPAKLLHWLMALLFFGMFIVAYIMINIPKSAFRFSLYDLHKATGMLLLCLVALRLSWRLINVQPKLSHSIPTWQHYAAKGNILLLYFLMFAMPLSGFLTSTLSGHDVSFYYLFSIKALGHNKILSAFFSQTHEILSYSLIAVFVIHVIGSLYHHYFLKDDVLKRMWIKRKFT